MKHTKYKTIQFDDEHHVLRRRITGNVTEKNYKQYQQSNKLQIKNI
jgi:hypothetical protein